ncbi:hypothetical protein [Solemya pervernicosa gill symbiont]|uniref:hypothetical protein n=1 Tax=Solemya pervernicosa gill symbiont TaxID=642797 RepID=UPI0010825E17|nr:hypothetical protein [Solemya pervernicosa gill symbiont]
MFWASKPKQTAKTSRDRLCLRRPDAIHGGQRLTAPLVWLILFPALLIDLSVSLFHAICFPLYGIPRVRRSDYIVIDRHYLRYLNIIERLNCIYCGYFNGLIAYIREIAARVEQHWCPIKHARHTAAFHSRYSNFIDYGDAKQFRQRYESIRGSFSDLKPDDK